MKTQIISLETHDDLISVRDKLSWVKTPRVLLVWPKYEKVSLRLLDLKVLQRHAASLGAQLGLVTRRVNVKRDAVSLGIPVFDSTTAAQKDPWSDPAPKSRRSPKAPRRDLRAVRDQVIQKEAAWRTSLAGRILTFTVGVFAVLAVAAVFMPRASVTLHPEEKIQSIVIPVSASEAVGSVSISGEIPARRVSVIVEVEQSMAIVNEIPVPDTKAQGIARFTNISEGEVEIPAGTVVGTDSQPPIQYRTMHGTLLEPGLGQFVDIPIEALQPGSRGNAPTGTIVVVDGALGRMVSVSNPKLVSGGTDKKLIGASDADREKLHEVVLENLRRDAETKLRAQLSAGDLLLPDTFELVRIVEEVYDPPAGEAGKTLKLFMQVGFSTRFVSEIDLDQLSDLALDSSVTEGFSPASEARVEPLTDRLTDASGVTRFDLEISRTLLRQLDEMRVILTTQGRKPGIIKAELMTGLPVRQEPDIVITPSWWPWMPLIPFNISVETR